MRRCPEPNSLPGRAARDATRLGVSINSHAFLADTSEEAADVFFPPYAETMTRIGRERGWPAVTRQHFDAMREPRGSLLVGSPEQVIEKVLHEHELFAHDRFLAQMTVGVTPHRKVMRSIELLGTIVAPAVRAEVARRSAQLSP
jgi:alkanesulfonate monooxygenase SsuD/methylene tetrahydromethanopterin reductase-like flavin-dependent oxidoreductase (luciferase family)